MQEGLFPNSLPWLFHGSLSIDSQYGSGLVSETVSKGTRKKTQCRSSGLFVT